MLFSGSCYFFFFGGGGGGNLLSELYGILKGSTLESRFTEILLIRTRGYC